MEENPTQLFHLPFPRDKKYQQVRIVLKPETQRSPNDNLKMFLNFGFSE